MSVYGNITFTMFVWIQCSRININIGIKFLDGNIIASGLQ